MQYKNLVDEGGFKHVREVVPVDQIWPLPPKVLVKGFSFGDKVDAYDNDGWWFEKISEKIGSEHLAMFYSLNSHLDITSDHKPGFAGKTSITPDSVNAGGSVHSKKASSMNTHKINRINAPPSLSFEGTKESSYSNLCHTPRRALDEIRVRRRDVPGYLKYKA
ncbi:hypothetical protein Tco_1118157 [Tanacetum coccineum]